MLSGAEDPRQLHADPVQLSQRQRGIQHRHSQQADNEQHSDQRRIRIQRAQHGKRERDHGEPKQKPGLGDDHCTPAFAAASESMALSASATSWPLPIACSWCNNSSSLGTAGAACSLNQPRLSAAMTRTEGSVSSSRAIKAGTTWSGWQPRKPSELAAILRTEASESCNACSNADADRSRGCRERRCPAASIRAAGMPCTIAFVRNGNVCEPIWARAQTAQLARNGSSKRLVNAGI